MPTDCQVRGGLICRAAYFATSLAALSAWMELSPAEGQDGGYVDKVRVAAPTRLDWAYPLIQRSPAEPPASLLTGYKSESQSYEFYGPADGTPGSLPLVIFVSPQDRPVGWPFWEPTCADHGVLFAGVRDMGNGKPVAHRVRAVLDVLDDVRDRFDVDPDRTYLAGFSGGAHVACVTALHLPEYFGGVVCIGHAPQPPGAPWLLARVRERLSLAIVCGDRESAGVLVDALMGPWWEGAGVRVEPVILRRHGHTMPGPDVMESAFVWLEAGLGDRREAARKSPSSRLAEAVPRAVWADRAVADANSRLETPVTGDSDADAIDAALIQLEGVVERWPDTRAAAAAKETLADYAGREERSWEAVRKADARRLLQLQAEGYARLATDGRRSVAGQRGQYGEYALAMWKQLRASGKTAEEIASAEAQIAELAKIVADAPAETRALAMAKVRFNITGDVTLPQGIAYLREAILGLGYKLSVDEAALIAAGVDMQRVYHPRLKGATFSEVDRRFLRRAGVMSQREGNEIRIVAVKGKDESRVPKSPSP